MVVSPKPQEQPPQEWAMTGWTYNSGGTLLRRYIHGPGADDVLLWYEGSGTGDKRYMHKDERGSVIALTNASGGIVGINSYDDHGIPASTNIGRFQYTGQT